MQTNSTNGVSTPAHEMLESLRLVIDKSAADLREQKQETEKLRAERNEYRRMLVDIVKPQLLSREEWEQFNEDDCKLTIDDLLADLNEK